MGINILDLFLSNQSNTLCINNCEEEIKSRTRKKKKKNRIRNNGRTNQNEKTRHLKN